MHHVVLGVGYDCNLLWIMKLTITMIVLMRSIPPFIAIVDSVYAMLVLGLNCNGLLCTLEVTLI